MYSLFVVLGSRYATCLAYVHTAQCMYVPFNQTETSHVAIIALALLEPPVPCIQLDKDIMPPDPIYVVLYMGYCTWCFLDALASFAFKFLQTE